MAAPLAFFAFLCHTMDVATRQIECAHFAGAIRIQLQLFLLPVLERPVRACWHDLAETLHKRLCAVSHFHNGAEHVFRLSFCAARDDASKMCVHWQSLESLGRFAGKQRVLCSASKHLWWAQVIELSSRDHRSIGPPALIPPTEQTASVLLNIKCFFHCRFVPINWMPPKCSVAAAVARATAKDLLPTPCSSPCHSHQLFSLQVLSDLFHDPVPVLQLGAARRK